MNSTAFSRRAKVLSLPSRTITSNIPGLTGRPVRARRVGWITLPRARPLSAAILLYAASVEARSYTSSALIAAMHCSSTGIFSALKCLATPFSSYSSTSLKKYVEASATSCRVLTRTRTTSTSFSKYASLAASLNHSSVTRPSLTKKGLASGRIFPAAARTDIGRSSRLAFWCHK